MFIQTLILTGGNRVDRHYRHRELTHYYDNDGCLVIKARMPADQGGLIIKALEMAIDRDDNGVPTDDITAETSDSEPSPEPIAARRADALAQIAET